MNFRSLVAHANPDINDEEYADIKANDLHPDSFDRATYSRLRRYGATHQEIQEACREAVPLEDYETARSYVDGDHKKAIEEGKRYRDYYRTSMAANNTFLRDNGDNFNAINPVLSEGEHAKIVENLFNHHASKRNRPTEEELPSDYSSGDTGIHIETSDRKRSHEWIMNECAKLCPSLKSRIQTHTEFNPDHLMDGGNEYENHVNKLMDHYNNRLVNSKTNLRSYLINRRLMNSVINIGSSKHSPVDYRHELYEEGDA